MDDDYEMAVNPNQMISGKSVTAKHINGNDVTLLHHNTLNASSKCNSKSAAIMLPTTSLNTISTGGTSNFSSSSSNSSNIMLSSGSTNFTAVAASIPASLHSNDALHTRLAFTSPKLVNSRAAMGTNIAIDCYESDTVDSSIIKEEPMSPDSSCPPSPISAASASTSANILDGTTGHIIVTQPTQHTGVSSQFGKINVNLANVASYTNADLVFEHSKVCVNINSNRPFRGRKMLIFSNDLFVHLFFRTVHCNYRPLHTAS